MATKIKNDINNDINSTAVAGLNVCSLIKAQDITSNRALRAQEMGNRMRIDGKCHVSCHFLEVHPIHRE